MILHRIPFLLPALALLLSIIACDSSEDPNLLNPPPPDSTRVRVVNLVPGEAVDATIGGLPLAVQLAPFSVSEFTSILFTDRVNFIANRPARRDTLFSEALTKGSRVSYFVLGTAGRTALVKATTGTLDETDLTERGMARVVFINAIPDTVNSFQIRRGCASGDTLYSSIFFSGISSQDILPQTLSLFLFASNDSLPAATARIDAVAGRVTYLIATRDNGTTRLFTLGTSPADPAGPLTPAPVEDRTEATVEILNALSSDITVAIQRGPTVTTDLPPLAISQPTAVPACADPRGDSILVTATGSTPAGAPIRLAVGSRSLVAAYGPQASPRVVTLGRTAPTMTAGKIYLRGVNLSSTAERTTVTVGAGAPAGVAEELRPFGTLTAGIPSNYVELPEGDYPLILRNATTGGFLVAGVERFDAGAYTVLVIDRNGTPELAFLREDIPATSLDAIDRDGTLATFFNLMPDLPASFTVGSLTIDSLAYSYTTSTVLPLDATTVMGNAGQATIDPTSGGYMIGATGSGSNRRLLAFRSPVGEPAAGKTAIRFLNATPDVPELHLFINTLKDQPDVTLTFGEPTAQQQLDPRKYSFIVRRPGDTAVAARLDGIELLNARSYVLAIGPGNDGGLGTLLMQE